MEYYRRQLSRPPIGGGAPLEVTEAVADERFRCPVCASVGFEPSTTGQGCTFCDGTEANSEDSPGYQAQMAAPLLFGADVVDSPAGIEQSPETENAGAGAAEPYVSDQAGVLPAAPLEDAGSTPAPGSTTDQPAIGLDLTFGNNRELLPFALEVAASDSIEWDSRSAGPAHEPQFMYLAGTAGTGKTYLARQRATNYDDAMLCATTGIAAVNLGGTTINSVLRYYDTASLQTEYEFGRLGVALRQLANSGFTRLIIDEVSMMDGRQLDIILLAVDEVNEVRISKEEKPLGITLVGDFAQLPPVKSPFVFERPAWERFEPNTLMLTEPRRQADPEFVRALQAVRRGDVSAVDYFRPYMLRAEIPDFDGSNILAKNDEVDRVNKVRMIKLAGPEEKFSTIRSGKQATEWKHIPEILILKPNALVMVLANKHDPDTKDLVYANGDLAHYKRAVVPNNPQSPAVCTLVRNGQEVVVQRVAREYGKATGAKGVKKDRETIEGSISYMPLRVAYGTTVHKSQGLSLDQVQLMINSQFWMQSGMLYVALSRARTPQGLKIVGTPEQFKARIRSNPQIAKWL